VSSRTALLINSRTDIALATGADGVHLRSDDISPSDVRRTSTRAEGQQERIVIGVSCHSTMEVGEAERQEADFVLFAPVFEKQGTQPGGLEGLREACRHRIPVLALGGINLDNAVACFATGAAGIAGIRLFQDNNVGEVVRKLKQL
jgi:thiamine-phosphate pyrophosphorylase